MLDQKPPPNFDPVNAALARYDREANGHYVVSGWQVIPLGLENGNQIFSITEGTINVWGNKLTRDAALRLSEPEAPDLHEVESEPHVIPSDADSKVQIRLNHTPVARIDAVTILRQKTVRLTHGGWSGVADPLPDTSVASIIKVSQGRMDYKPGDDFILKGDRLDWSPRGAEGGTPDRDTNMSGAEGGTPDRDTNMSGAEGGTPDRDTNMSGAEPAPGSTYDVVYQYLDTVEPDSWNASSVTVTGAVPGSTAIIRYHWALPRIDALAVTREGEVLYLKGQSALYDPWPPRVPNDAIKLAEIVNRWGKTPEVRNIATHSVHYNMLELYGDLIFDLFDLVAQERLKRDMDSREPTAKRGVFVDPFLDDDMRDQGISQNGAIADEALRLPILPVVHPGELGERPFMLPFEEEVLIEQPLVTGCMKINPYQAFEAFWLPSPRLRLVVRLLCRPVFAVSPNARGGSPLWTEIRTRWASALTERFVRGTGNRARVVRSQRVETVRTGQQDARFLRRRVVRFWIEGFGPGEILDRVEFDGVRVNPEKA